MARFSTILKLCGLLSVTGSLSGCLAPTCDITGDNMPIVNVRNGQTSTDGMHYQTSSWNGPYLPLAAGQTYRFYHGLKSVPYFYKTYLAFTDSPIGDAGQVVGNTAEAAGNSVLIELVNDQYIQLQNNSCVEFYLRLVAGTADFPDVAAATDAGSP